MSTENSFSDIEYADADTDSMDNMEDELTLTPEDEVDWRENVKSLKSNLEYSLNHDLFNDLTCVLGQGENQESLRCNSFFLRLSSKYFDNYFINHNFPSEVAFPNYSPNAFKKFLLFVYTERFHVSVTEAIPLLEIAKEFQVQSLVERCCRVLKDQIDIPNCCKIYTSAFQLFEPELEEFARNFALENASEVFKTQGFLDLPQPCVKSLLESQDKKISEVAAFNAIIRWAKEQCEHEKLELSPSNLRIVLKGMVNLIKFEEFSAIEFSEFVVDTEILNENKALQTLKKLNLKQSRSTLNISKLSIRAQSSSSSGISESSGSSPTSYSQRLLHNSQELLSEPTIQTDLAQIFNLKRYKSTVSGSWKHGGIEKLTFMCHKSLNFSGIGIYGRSSVELHPITASFTLSTYEETVQVASVRKVFPASPNCRMLRCLFECPVSLVAKQWYTIVLDVSGEVQCFGNGKKKMTLRLGKESVVVEFKIRKISSKFPSFPNSQGTIPELYFSI